MDRRPSAAIAALSGRSERGRGGMRRRYRTRGRRLGFATFLEACVAIVHLLCEQSQHRRFPPVSVLSRAARAATRPSGIRRILAGTVGTAVAAVALPLMSAPSAHALTAVGPTAAFGPGNTVIPQWYSDATGLRLQPCLVATAVCFQVPGLAPGAAGFAAPNGEAFYWVAFGNLNTAGTLGPVASQLTMGVEAAFAPAPGPNVFNRIRFRIGVPTPGVYTVTYPYGQKTFNVT